MSHPLVSCRHQRCKPVSCDAPGHPQALHFVSEAANASDVSRGDGLRGGRVMAGMLAFVVFVLLMLAIGAQAQHLIPRKIGHTRIDPGPLFLLAALAGAVALGSGFLWIERRITDRRKP